jgi:ubiquinone/menaquinone biosynthesis C-methylase UbiE
MILDVGCGSNPRGDVNVDAMFIHDEWKGQVDCRLIPNFVKADAAHLPFREKCFQEVFSSHLLEHVKDEKAVLDEMRRVSEDVVRIVVPVEFVWFLYDFFHPKKFLWASQHHKRSYGLNPFGARNVRLRFPNLKRVLMYRKVSYEGRLRLPVPLETETVLDSRV